MIETTSPTNVVGARRFRETAELNADLSFERKILVHIIDLKVNKN
jgi:hypothetical protein